MSETTVTVLPKPETVLDVDLSAEVECQSSEGCQIPAVWGLSFACGHTFTLCQTHHDREASRLRDGWWLWCRECGEEINAMEWRRL